MTLHQFHIAEIVIVCITAFIYGSFIIEPLYHVCMRFIHHCKPTHDPYNIENSPYYLPKRNKNENH